MKKNTFLLFAVMLTIQSMVCSQVTDSTVVTGNKVITFQSGILHEKRKITIQTPANASPFDVFPVLYILDGEVQAELAGSQVKYLSESYRVVPKMIIVSIHNTDRMRDLTPTRDLAFPNGILDTTAKAPGRNTGGGPKFIEFIKTELMPYINKHYPVAPYNILYGHSLGGLMCMYTMLHHPGMFDAYIALSPSFQWDKKKLLGEMAALKITKQTFLLFSDANEDSAFHSNQLALEQALSRSNNSLLSYKRTFYPADDHVSSPVKGFYEGIRFIYPSWHLNINQSFRKNGNAAMVKEHYSGLTKRYGYNVQPAHDEINQIARFFRNDSARVKDAVALLQWNAGLYPSSAVIYQTLGDTYKKAGETDKANKAYAMQQQLEAADKSKIH